MKYAILFIALLIPVIAQSASSNAYSGGSLSTWLNKEAVPGLVKTLTLHPRFKKEAIYLVDLEDNKPAQSSEGLTTAILDSLYAELMLVPDLQLARVNGPEQCASRINSGYFLAVEVTSVDRGTARVELRIFDIVEKRWVSGFGQQWRGKLSKAQRSAIERQEVADNVLGERILPFSAHQSDLMAAKLAAELACQLKRRGDDEIEVQPARYQSAGLIAGNLADHNIPIASSGGILLETRVHTVNPGLYQVWAILSPREADGGVAAITASAYASSPLLQPRSVTASDLSAPVETKRSTRPRAPDLLSELRLLSATDHCDAGQLHPNKPESLNVQSDIYPGSCFGLQFLRQTRSHFYLVRQSNNAGLVRLYPSRCDRKRPEFSKTAIRFPFVGEAISWNSSADLETYHVVVAGNDTATRQLDKLMARLPDSCSPDGRQKLSEKSWLNSLRASMKKLGSDVAWQSLDVRHAVDSRGARR